MNESHIAEPATRAIRSLPACLISHFSPSPMDIAMLLLVYDLHFFLPLHFAPSVFSVDVLWYCGECLNFRWTNWIQNKLLNLSEPRFPHW